MRKIVVLIPVLLGVLAVLFFPGCRPGQPEPLEEPVIPVKTEKVVVRQMAIPIHTSGRLHPKAQVKLSFKTGGLIDKIRADEGETVRKGQRLAALDLSEIEARFSQAKNACLKAERDKERLDNLYRDKAATLEQLQNVNTALEIARADLNIARFNLEHSQIAAPADGKILKRLAEKGEMIGVGQPVFLFGSTESRWVVKAGVSESAIVRLTLQDSAEVRFDAYPGQVFSARVSEMSEALDPASGTFEVELTIEAAAMKLVSGFVAKVDIFPSQKRTFSLIPLDALVEGEGSRGFVYIVKDKKASKVKIEIAHLFADRAAVESGLSGISEVISRGAAYLHDGSPVEISD
jgi:multidrug efflux system membrane fusion protein